MWYVMQVYSGREQQAKDIVMRYGGDLLIEECRIPRYMEQKKIHGKWIIEYKTLFPGYLFLKTDKVNELFVKMKKAPQMTRLLCVGEQFAQLSAEEEKFLIENLDEESVLGLSRGISVNGKIEVIKGPLKGLERFIKKVDRHRRLAWLSLPFSEWESKKVCVGLEIINKI